MSVVAIIYGCLLCSALASHNRLHSLIHPDTHLCGRNCLADGAVEVSFICFRQNSLWEPHFQDLFFFFLLYNSWAYIIHSQGWGYYFHWGAVVREDLSEDTMLEAEGKEWRSQSWLELQADWAVGTRPQARKHVCLPGMEWRRAQQQTCSKVGHRSWGCTRECQAVGLAIVKSLYVKPPPTQNGQPAKCFKQDRDLRCYMSWCVMMRTGHYGEWIRKGQDKPVRRLP